jgi:hypothetical protein
MPEQAYKPSVFIASSGKSKPLAEAVKLQFEAEADVDIWTENIFKLNEGALDTLLNRASYYDFFIALFAADDKVTLDTGEKDAVRDNVIFEFGLFLGRIGIHRTFFILEEGVDLFSDWKGITTTRFVRRDNLVAALGASCIRIRESMKVAERLFDYTILPSTALAIGYYHNFLGPVLEAFQRESSIEVIGKDKQGNETRFVQEIRNHWPTIEIRTPRNLRALSREVLNIRTKDYKQLILKTKVRPFPFYVQGRFGEKASLHLFDIPTTLLASYFTIQAVFSPAFLASEHNLQRLMDREIRNFEKTLSRLIPDDIEQKVYSFRVIS